MSFESLPKPWVTGVVRGPDQLADGDPGFDIRRVPANTRLSTLAADWVLFTTGIWECAREQLLAPSLFALYGQHRNELVRPACFVLPRSIIFGFEQLGDGRWNYRLLGLPRSVFDDFSAWASVASFLDSRAKQLYRLRFIEVFVPDNLDRPVSSAPLTVSVQTIGIDSTLGCAYVFQPIARIAGPCLPQVRLVSEVVPETASFLEKLLGGSSDPFQSMPRGLYG